MEEIAVEPKEPKAQKSSADNIAMYIVILAIFGIIGFAIFVNPNGMIRHVVTEGTVTTIEHLAPKTEQESSTVAAGDTPMTIHHSYAYSDQYKVVIEKGNGKSEYYMLPDVFEKLHPQIGENFRYDSNTMAIDRLSTKIK